MILLSAKPDCTSHLVRRRRLLGHFGARAHGLHEHDDEEGGDASHDDVPLGAVPKAGLNDIRILPTVAGGGLHWKKKSQ